ncbi:MAG: triose-phosphate isomerase [Phycisphaeraceae bacterium]|nr:triose-phosphate isomerase [Phycisphaeraceae bacterium]MBX3368059.1 triose-phosphate isomerase [Phycisphaeraceae bacterium]
MRQPIVGGNWKMNTNRASGVELARAVAASSAGTQAQVVVFPPFPYLLTIADTLKGSRVMLGAQDVSDRADGAFTGEVSCAMLRDCGATWVLAGHSERRHVIGESDVIVNAKARAALAAGLGVILCIGEKLDQRERGETDIVNETQLRAGLAGVEPASLAHVVIAYEPVWAIGTGKTASPADAQAAHAHIRKVLRSMYGAEHADAMRIQYGGSVTAANAKELFSQPDIDGGLIGGASLKPADFAQIVAAASP